MLGKFRTFPNFSDNLKYARKSSEVSYRWSRVTGRFFVSASRSLVVSFRMTCDFCRIYFGVVLIELQSSAFMQRRRFTLPGFCGQNSFIFLLRQNKFPVTLSIKKYLWKLYFNSWSFVYVNDSRNCALSLTIMQRSNYSESWANLSYSPFAVGGLTSSVNNKNLHGETVAAVLSAGFRLCYWEPLFLKRFATVNLLSSFFFTRYVHLLGPPKLRHLNYLLFRSERKGRSKACFLERGFAYHAYWPFKQ